MQFYGLDLDFNRKLWSRC